MKTPEHIQELIDAIRDPYTPADLDWERINGAIAAIKNREREIGCPTCGSVHSEHYPLK